MAISPEPHSVRKGKFLWMDEPSKQSYLAGLRRKIDEGYFFSDSILSRVTEELAPVLGEATET